MAALHNCLECNQEYKIERGDFDYTELAGLDSDHQIILRDVERRTCGCGVTPVIPNPAGLHYIIGLALILNEAPITGSAIRFLRKTLEMTQTEFASLIDIAPPTLSKWENGHKTPDLKVRAFAAMQYLAKLVDMKVTHLVGQDTLWAATGAFLVRAKEMAAAGKVTFLSEASMPTMPAWRIADMQKKGIGGNNARH